ncbi:MAG TPA: ribulose-phosphate 3-epimerase [Sphaerochaeta sp.]|nr:MAG: ribulose-phosphate 3-epimerase [Spirochaetes bacterium GWC2_52_13]OHD65445.1 MAG: ribulose-phosphate 3-epimerase [Spirochaetes bacterium GWF2_52_7]PKL20316.1 MAG: ribulose-phosphate 3-epimerase [Spirochaetae bacterium HGW-Spirochaetae-4]HCG62386.1 ribulose-phosphate 3-epimerase [Sphaerochaeta sp.]HCJ93984.1 ribulose-phosphate 3-epimerase [Sphaerochaeta sp.]
MNIEPRCILAPSMLSADFSCAGEAVAMIGKTTAQWIHLDVMDGLFVPNISFGPKFIEDIRPLSSLVFDTHLMVDRPERFIVEFARAGSDIITVHAEASVHLHRTLGAIHDEGKQAGVSLVPSTPVSSIEMVLDEVELVLVMSVDPGFGGQKFIANSLDKIRQLDALRKKHKLDFRISVDGGVNANNADLLVEAGVDVLVMGSAFFNAGDKKSFAARIQGMES